jgi:hypothetical protein
LEASREAKRVYTSGEVSRDLKEYAYGDTCRGGGREASRGAEEADGEAGEESRAARHTYAKASSGMCREPRRNICEDTWREREESKARHSS